MPDIMAGVDLLGKNKQWIFERESMKKNAEETDIETYCGILGNIQKAEFIKKRLAEVNELKKGLLSFWHCLSWAGHEWPPVVETCHQIGKYELTICLKERGK